MAAPPPAKTRLNDTAHLTLQAFRAGKTVEQIARERKLTAGTIYGHLTTAIEAGESVDLERLLSREQQRQIEAAFAKTGLGNISGAKELLGEGFDFDQLRIFRAAKNAGVES